MSTGRHVIYLLRKTLETLRRNEGLALCGEWTTKKRPDYEDKQVALKWKERNHGDL